MGTQQVQDPPILQRGKALPWKQVKRFIYTLVVITLLFFIVGAIIWILTTLGIIHGPVFDKLFVIFNGLGGAAVAVLAFFGIVQFILSLIPSQAEQSATPSSTPTSPVPSFPTQQIIVQVSQTPSTPPLSPPPNKAPYRGIVSLPPPTDPKTIQQREKAVQQVYDKLTQPDITAMVLTGIGGAGKSTLAALVYNYAEEQGRAGKGPFTAEPLWLRIDPAVTMIDLTGNLVEALGKPLPDLSNLSPENQAVALFNALNSVDKPRLVILDQFENLLDLKTGYALSDRPGIGEWLDALNSQQCTCHILLTSRPFPQGTRDYPPVLLQEYAVGGLEEAEAIDLLRKQGVKGTEAELRIAFERCAGHALSLTLLATLMRTRNLSMATLLKDPAYTQLWSGNIARNLLDSIYSKQLDEWQRESLQAFSVYREPVPLEAALTIMGDNAAIPRTQAEFALDGLLAQHLVQASGEGRYQLHVIVAAYVQDHFVDGDEQANQQALRAAHGKAAQYYLRQAAANCPPREKRRQVSDVRDLVEAIWQYCQAERWQEAYDLMQQEGIFGDLNRWGGNAILLELYQLLLSDNWKPERSQASLIYHNLGWVYDDLGQKQKALSYYEQALKIDRELGNHRSESATLVGLGRVYDALGQKRKALDYYEQALQIMREVGDRGGEGTTLNNLGRVYDDLGQKQEALTYYEQALQITREVGDRGGEGTTLHNIGTIYFEQSRYDVALACFLLARGIFEEVQSPDHDEVQSWIDELREEVGEKQFAPLLAQVEPQADQIVERALREGV